VKVVAHLHEDFMTTCVHNRVREQDDLLIK